MLAAIFPIYFNTVLGQNTLGLQLKGYAASFVMLLSAISCPVLGTIGDCRGMKKRLWAVFVFTGAGLTLCLSFVNTWQLLLAGYILSNLAYNCAVLFYDSFLTDVTTPERMHRVSTWAFAIGYLGGGVMLLILSVILMAMNGISNPESVKIAFALTAAWWIIFSLPMMIRVKQTHSSDKSIKEVTHNLFFQLRGTIISIINNKGLLFFILAYFFYIDGVGTVITMATSYGNTLGLSSTLMIAALLTTQIVAVPFSILFGKLASKFSAVRLITVAIGVYICICIIAFYMGYSIETSGAGITYDSAINHGQILFWVMAGMVGMVQGGIQALSRSQFGQMVPRERSNEYFGFFSIFSRFASILGPFLMALTTGITGRSSFGILSVIILFIAGGALLLSGRKHINAL